MCSICGGKTPEEFLEGMADKINELGFTVIGVEPSLDHPPWVYTVGLVEACEHPEISLAGESLEFAHRYVSGMATAALEGEIFRDGETIGNDYLHFHISNVDTRLWKGDAFAAWHEYYDWRGSEIPWPCAVELSRCQADSDLAGVVGL